MSKLQSILLASTLALTASCVTPEKPFVPYTTDASRKELVKNPGEVITAAKSHKFPVYVLRKNGDAVSYYTEGIVKEKKEGIGSIEYGLECTDNIWLFDDDTYNGMRTFNEEYSAERIDPK